MSYYIIWYTDENTSGEYENYIIVGAEGITSAHQMATEMFGDYVISVEPYEP